MSESLALMRSEAKKKGRSWRRECKPHIDAILAECEAIKAIAPSEAQRCNDHGKVPLTDSARKARNKAKAVRHSSARKDAFKVV